MPRVMNVFMIAERARTGECCSGSKVESAISFGRKYDVVSLVARVYMQNFVAVIFF